MKLKDLILGVKDPRIAISQEFIFERVLLNINKNSLRYLHKMKSMNQINIFRKNSLTKSKDQLLKDELGIIEYVRENRLNERSNLSKYHILDKRYY